jgi:hypothetical protein
LGVLNSYAPMLSIAANGSRTCDAEVSQCQRQGRVASTEGSQAADFAHQFERQLRDLYIGIDEKFRLWQIYRLLLDSSGEGLSELGNPLRVEGESSGSGMTPVSNEEMIA